MATIHPVVDEGLGNSAYVVELGDGRALVVDPARDPTPYLQLARWRRLQIAYAVETHLHADFLTGSRELAAADGAEILAPRASRLGFAHRGLEDGEEVDLGGLTLRALATPGHAPEHVSYLLLDDRQPVALFSGGALLVGTVARTDLAGPELTEPLARAAYRSLHQRLLPLPDELAVYPTHGAGSFCSAPAGGERTTTIGAERRHNRLLAAPDEDAFVAQLLAGFGSYPPYFLRLRERNRVGPELLGRRLAGPAPALDRPGPTSTWPAAGVLVDARPIDRVRRRPHPRGAVDRAAAAVRQLAGLARRRHPAAGVRRWTRTRTAGSWPASAAPSATTTWWASWPAAWPPGEPPACPEAQLPLVEAEQLDDQPGRGAGCPPGQRGRRRPPPRRRHRRAGRPGRRPATGGAPGGAGHGDVRPRRAGHDRRQPARPRRPQGPPGRPSAARRTGSGPPARPWPARDPAGAGPPRVGCGWGCGPTWPSSRLLVGVNALVGGMVGQERSLLSLLATETFGLAAVSAALTFIVAFGLTKAATNFLAGTLADRYGRKPVLVAGWLRRAARCRC